MTKFWTLAKVNLLQTLYQMNLVRRRGDRGGRSFLTTLLIVAVLLMAYTGWMAYILSQALVPAHAEWLLLAAAFLFITLFIFATSLYTVGSLLFESTDTDQLFAYPVSKFEIVAAKITGLVVETWILTLVFGLGFFVMYAYYSHPSALFYVYAVILLIVSPGVPLFAIGLISFVIGLVTSGTRFKQYLNTILTVGAIAGMVVAINVAVRRVSTAITSPDQILDTLKRVYPPVGYATAALYQGSAVDLLIAVAWNVVPFLALCGLIAWSYAFIRTRLTAVHKARGGKIRYDSASADGALIRKEFTRFASSPMYILNSCLGAILTIAMSVLLGLGAGRNLSSVVGSMELFGINLTEVFLLVALVTLSLSNTTAPSISLEGRNLWIVQSLPVPARSVLRAKLILHWTVLGGMALIACAIAAFTVRTGLGGFFVVLIPCLLFVLVSSLVGLVYNLRFHRFDFYNDMTVVKNSASVLLTTGTMVIVVALIMVVYALVGQWMAINFYVYWGAWVAVLAVAAVVLYRWLMTRGTVQFANLS